MGKEEEKTKQLNLLLMCHIYQEKLDGLGKTKNLLLMCHIYQSYFPIVFSPQQLFPENGRFNFTLYILYLWCKNVFLQA